MACNTANPDKTDDVEICTWMLDFTEINDPDLNNDNRMQEKDHVQCKILAHFYFPLFSVQIIILFFLRKNRDIPTYEDYTPKALIIPHHILE